MEITFYSTAITYCEILHYSFVSIIDMIQIAIYPVTTRQNCIAFYPLMFNVQETFDFHKRIMKPYLHINLYTQEVDVMPNFLRVFAFTKLPTVSF